MFEQRRGEVGHRCSRSAQDRRRAARRAGFAGVRAVSARAGAGTARLCLDGRSRRQHEGWPSRESVETRRACNPFSMTTPGILSSTPRDRVTCLGEQPLSSQLGRASARTERPAITGSFDFTLQWRPDRGWQLLMTVPARRSLRQRRSERFCRTARTSVTRVAVAALTS